MKFSATDPTTSGLQDVRRLVHDLFEHRTHIYWIDMLSSAVLGWIFFSMAFVSTSSLTLCAAALVAAAFAFLRAVLFIHEISHFRRGVLRGFSAVWNLVVGIPLFLPSFMYVGTHTDHHKRHLYGTPQDPEYLPLAHGTRGRILRFLGEMLLVPLLLVLRYGVLSPLSWLVPPLRRLVIQRASALVINPAYCRRAPKGQEAFWWMMLEGAIFALFSCLVAGTLRGIIPLRLFLLWYVMAAFVALINQVRTLAAHHYTNTGEPVDVTTQVLDSVNITGKSWMIDLIFPVGLRFHALHHYLPDMPYHSLPEAHRRLMENLPSDAAYRRVNYTSFVGVIQNLWRTSSRASAPG